MKNLLFTLFVFLAVISNGFAQRSAVHTLTNFNLNTSNNTFSFDIYSQSTGTSSIGVGITSFYLDFNSTALNNPVLTYINPRYSGVPDGSTTDYKTMTIQNLNNKLAVTIYFTGNNVGASILSTASPMGELMCSIQLNIVNQNALANVSWDLVNSSMSAFLFTQTVSNSFQGSNTSPLPVELSSFNAKSKGPRIELKWRTESEVRNAGFDIERKSDKSDWKKISFVPGAGNRNNPKEYTFSDLPSEDTKFQYRLKQIDVDGKFTYSPAVDVTLDIPTKFSLDQNYPNPFNPSTNVRFELPKDSHVSLKVYNLIGQEIAELVNGDFVAGYHSIAFNASNLASGTYIYRIDAGSFSQVKKMMLIK